MTDYEPVGLVLDGEMLCALCGEWHDMAKRWPDKCTPYRPSDPRPALRTAFKQYVSPIDGGLIASQSVRLMDLNVNNCIPADQEIGKVFWQRDREPGKYRNPRFARKYGLPLVKDPRQYRPAINHISAYLEKYRMRNKLNNRINND